MADECAGPPIRVIEVDSIETLLEELSPCSLYFTLLLAWDAPEISKSVLVEYMRPLVERGLVYFCAWGNRCEAVHDAVDYANLERTEKSGGEEHLVMTTWHREEQLSEACWFFKTLALPAEEPFISSFDRFAVAVNNKKWVYDLAAYLA